MYEDIFTSHGHMSEKQIGLAILAEVRMARAEQASANHFLNSKISQLMSLTDDLSAQLDRIEAAQADAKTQNDTISTEIGTLISEIGTTPGISAEDAAKLIARAKTIADASEALDTALKGSASAGANNPPPPPADGGTPPATT